MRGTAALCLLALLAPLAIHAQTRTERLCWTQQTPPPVTGWRAHFGTASRAYTSQKDMGAPSADASGKRCYNVQNLPSGTLYFAATAYGATESPLSNEQVRPAQVAPPPPPPPASIPGPAGRPQLSSVPSASPTVDVSATWTAAERATAYRYGTGPNTAGAWTGQSGTVPAASVLLRTVPRGGSIWFCVAGTNTAGEGSSSCNSYAVPAAQATPPPPPPPPPPPIAAPAQPSCAHIPTPQVRYTWAPVPNAVKYRVYPAGTSVFLTPESTTPSVVFDLGVSSFAVEVTAVTSDGRESVRSPRVTVPAAGPCR